VGGVTPPASRTWARAAVVQSTTRELVDVVEDGNATSKATIAVVAPVNQAGRLDTGQLRL